MSSIRHFNPIWIANGRTHALNLNTYLQCFLMNECFKIAVVLRKNAGCFHSCAIKVVKYAFATSKHYINGINSSNIRITCSFRRRCILWFVMHRRECRFKCLQSTIHISECRIYVTNWRLNEKCDHLVTVHHTKWRRKISFFSIWGKLSLKYWIFPISLTSRIFHVYTTSHL